MGNIPSLQQANASKKLKNNSKKSDLLTQANQGFWPILYSKIACHTHTSPPSGLWNATKTAFFTILSLILDIKMAVTFDLLA